MLSIFYFSFNFLSHPLQVSNCRFFLKNAIYKFIKLVPYLSVRIMAVSKVVKTPEYHTRMKSRLRTE